ncbi:MAG: ATP-binding protein [Bacteroidetes bacterium]|nr:ATP-binding protein [Bacteroidota bacterium]
MIELKDFMINNFKIFEGEHWFSFKDINVFTGPNNAGKSSFIQALQLFSEGFEKSDFPMLDLVGGSENLGDFHEVVNNKSSQKRFGFGFNVHIRNIDHSFKVIYTFQQGEKLNEKYIVTAPFLSMELIDTSGEVFLGIYDRYKYWGEEGNSPLKSPFTGTDHTSMLNGKLNLHLLKKYAKSISPKYDIEELWKHLKNTFIDYWWFEAFKEYDGYGNTIFNKRFNDLLHELTEDYYTNLADFSLKEDIHFTDADITDEVNKYTSILTKTNYRNFLSGLLFQIFDAIEEGLSVFWIYKENHIKSSDLLQGKLFPISKKTDFLYKLAEKQEDVKYKNFILDCIEIFRFNEFPMVKLIENSVFTIKLHAINETKKKEEKKEDTHFSLVDFDPLHKKIGKLKYDLSNYGKGTINILTLILKVASLILHEKQSADAEKFIKKEQVRKEDIKKIVLVEEPEAFLHPNWQSKLADFFVYCVKNYDIQFFIETHSVYLIQKIQVLTSKGILTPDQMNILYFNPGDKKQKFYNLPIRLDGLLMKEFGSGFFDESLKLTIDLLKIENQN